MSAPREVWVVMNKDGEIITQPTFLPDERVERWDVIYTDGAPHRVVRMVPESELTALRAERDALQSKLDFLGPELTTARTGHGALARENAALKAKVEALRSALRDVCEREHCYVGKDADTANPESLYSAVRRGRACLAAKEEG